MFEKNDFSGNLSPLLEAPARCVRAGNEKPLRPHGSQGRISPAGGRPPPRYFASGVSVMPSSLRTRGAMSVSAASSK